MASGKLPEGRTMSACSIATRPDGVVVMMIDQPESRANVLSTGLWNDLDAAVAAAVATPHARGLVIASAKPGIFIAGADLKLLGTAPTPNDPAVEAFIRLGLGVLARIESAPFATIAAIDGAALGGGLEVALACDFRIVGTHPKIQLGLPETTLGLIPGWGGTQRLPRIVGLETAATMLATAKSVSAAEAVEKDLAIEQVQSESIIDAAAAVLLNLTGEMKHEARRIKTRAIADADRAAFRPSVPSEPNAVREALLVMLAGAETSLDEAMPLETAAFLRLTGTPESRQRIQDFFNRKK
jgi:enoyl-CoA hydratase